MPLARLLTVARLTPSTSATACWVAPGRSATTSSTARSFSVNSSGSVTGVSSDPLPGPGSSGVAGASDGTLDCSSLASGPELSSVGSGAPVDDAVSVGWSPSVASAGSLSADAAGSPYSSRTRSTRSVEAPLTSSATSAIVASGIDAAVSSIFL
jgi:hypothetical protein